MYLLSRFLLILVLLVSSATAHAQELYFTIIHTNDEHSSFLPRGSTLDYHPDYPDDTVGGMARLATAINRIRAQKAAQGEPVLLLSGADYIGGTPFAWLNLKNLTPELTIMHEIGYDVITIGNHEFDYGPDHLGRYFLSAGYPDAHDKTVVSASNIIPPPGHDLEKAGIKDVYIRELENGLRVGFIGLLWGNFVLYATETGGVIFLDFIEEAKRAVSILEEQDIDVIIAITHAGLEEDRELARAVPAIDVIVGGHCHTALYNPVREGNTIIVQAGSLVRYLGVLELAYDMDTGTLRSRNTDTQTPYLVEINNSFEPDPVIEAMVGKYTEILDSWIQEMTDDNFKGLLEVVAYSEFTVSRRSPGTETPLGNLVTDAMRLIASEKLGKRVDFAFQINSHIRNSIVPGQSEHARNLISFYDLAEVICLGSGIDANPGYPLVAFYLTGAEVRNLIEISAILAEYLGSSYSMQVSGLRYTYDPRRAILMTLPTRNIPIPSGRAVLKAQRFMGQGIQSHDDNDYVPITRGDQDLYLVVADSFVLSFIPMVGEVLPYLEVKPRDEKGNPILDYEKLVIRKDGNEVKIWQALVEFVTSQPPNKYGLPMIPQYYESTAERITEKRALPLVGYPLLLLLLLILGLLLL